MLPVEAVRGLRAGSVGDVQRMDGVPLPPSLSHSFTLMRVVGKPELHLRQGHTRRMRPRNSGLAMPHFSCTYRWGDAAAVGGTQLVARAWTSTANLAAISRPGRNHAHARNIRRSNPTSSIAARRRRRMILLGLDRRAYAVCRYDRFRPRLRRCVDDCSRRLPSKSIISFGGPTRDRSYNRFPIV